MPFPLGTFSNARHVFSERSIVVENNVFQESQKTIKFTFDKCVVNVIPFPMPTQYTKNDIYIYIKGKIRNPIIIGMIDFLYFRVFLCEHVVQELGELLEANGTEVCYAIHPVAGRMPGHMNVLLAEANVSYDQLVEMDDINPRMDSIDVCVVIGANDVVNPAALEDESSPIYGMPIIETFRAKTVIVLKRSMNPGFAGIQNALFFNANTRMYFGDAKASIQALVGEFKSD